MSNAQPGGYYFAPPSHWPVVGSVALFFIATGGVLLMNSYGAGWIPFGIGFFTLIYSETFNPAALMALVLTLALMAIALNELVRLVETRFSRWKE